MRLSPKEFILFILILTSLIFFFRNIFFIILNDKICIYENIALIEHKVARESILQGQYPGWDPYNSRPILSNPKSQIFYPPALILNLILGPELMIKILLIGGILISLLTIYKLSALIGLGRNTSVFLSLLYIALNNIILHSIRCNLEYIFSFPLIPLALIYYVYWINSKKTNFFLFSIISLCFINLSGSTQLFLITTVLMLVYSKLFNNKFEFSVPLFALLLSSIKIVPYFILRFNISSILIFFPTNIHVMFIFFFFFVIFILKLTSEKKYSVIFFLFLLLLTIYTIILNSPEPKIYQISRESILPIEYTIKISTITNVNITYFSPNDISGYLYLNNSYLEIEPKDLFFIHTYYHPPNGWYGYINKNLVFSFAGLEGIIQLPINISSNIYQFELVYTPLFTIFGLEITIFSFFLIILYLVKPQFLTDNYDKLFLLLVIILQIQLFLRMFFEEKIHQLAPEEISLFNLLRRGYAFPSAYTTHAAYFTPTITSIFWRLSISLTKSYSLMYTAVIPYIFYICGSIVLFLLTRTFLSKNSAILITLLYVSDAILIRSTRILMDCHILPFFIIATLYFLLKYINSIGRKRLCHLFAFAIISGLGTMTQFSYLMFLIPCIIIFMILYRKKIEIKELLLCSLIFLIIVSPHILLYYTPAGSKHLGSGSLNLIKDLINRYLQILFFKESRGFNFFHPTHISDFYFITSSRKIDFFIYLTFIILIFIISISKKMIKKEELFIFIVSLICITIFPSYETTGILLVPLWIIILVKTIENTFTILTKIRLFHHFY
ncbi:MAG: glycosyltransferase family 39 protein [Candidatus Parvarchaeota archaeon]|nr:glycosyltransferase family 39 protein [Candidatus Jingweiarchaeum tengchongense]MCW1298428.1 glycosyltransferase family 39 protein [Candidatus Jingweiarchaeum tengchongense]MCW1310838.1 glycosyltransferase family 39 protein [Candidatus Jingweiarchaeum tengchongense]